MIEVAILGAGSIGNHLSFSCRKIGWNVSVFDVSLNALERMKSEIFPQRYGVWDSSINLLTLEDFGKFSKGNFDVCLVGTPPDTHLELLRMLANASPSVIMVEKPVVPPSINEILGTSELIRSHSKIEFLVGYNHRVSLVIRELVRTWKSLGFKTISRLDVNWLESWDGIMKAHPWLATPKDSYLGYTSRGGGAIFEHSHGIDLWLWLSRVFGLGESEIVEASGKLVGDSKGESYYDENVQILVKNNSSLVGSIRQDVSTSPADKSILVEDDTYEYRCQFHVEGTSDIFTVTEKQSRRVIKKVKVEKTRSVDFDEEIYEIQNVLINISEARKEISPLDASFGLQTAMLGTVALNSILLQKPLDLDFGSLPVPSISSTMWAS